ncbi:MAG: hypothetical protein A3G73_05575 [Rhodospirillales bacterium RIFCSPLOWO2_12_FULL_67_15]|nr:MAG: hypothetical protein A3G73_05575 [Rhodospirillales bacterium RIFCSPLOWO2_12_FULL_67_15]
MAARTTRKTAVAVKKSRESSPASFDQRFAAAARKVLKRRGVPEHRLEAEIARLRRLRPNLDLPTVAEIERTLDSLGESI